MTREELKYPIWVSKKSSYLYYMGCLQFLTIINIRTNGHQYIFDVGFCRGDLSISRMWVGKAEILLKDVSRCYIKDLQKAFDKLIVDWGYQTIQELKDAGIEGTEKLYLNGI